MLQVLCQTRLIMTLLNGIERERRLEKGGEKERGIEKGKVGGGM